mmetsp:Transcript_3705/g.5909  ORF Transcript_3705/g.5909 Transcript_3705/m.5909 type:complete len:207 (+) Transcript_3705:862-1482(+)
MDIPTARRTDLNTTALMLHSQDEQQEQGATGRAPRRSVGATGLRLNGTPRGSERGTRRSPDRAPGLGAPTPWHAVPDLRMASGGIPPVALPPDFLADSPGGLPPRRRSVGGCSQFNSDRSAGGPVLKENEVVAVTSGIVLNDSLGWHAVADLRRKSPDGGSRHARNGPQRQMDADVRSVKSTKRTHPQRKCTRDFWCNGGKQRLTL